MFTGIVQGIAQIHSIDEKSHFRTQTVKMPQELMENLEIGASVANNGVCLTVTKIEGPLVSFDLMTETLRITNLGRLQAGDFVNIERAMKMGDEIGGIFYLATFTPQLRFLSVLFQRITCKFGSSCLSLA